MTTKYLPPQKKDLSSEDFPKLGNSTNININNVWKKVDTLKETININNQKEIEDKIQRSKELKDFKQLFKSSQLLPKIYKKNNDDDDDDIIIDQTIVNEEIIDDDIIDEEKSESEYDGI